MQAKNKYPGIKYLLYSLLLGKDKDKECIKSQTIFNIQFKAKEIDRLKEVEKGLLFLQFFGGIGSRSRRGAGCIKIKKISPNIDNLDFDYLFDMSSINTRKMLVNRYKEISRLISDTREDSYSILKESRVFVFTNRETWYDALEFIGSKFKKFRDHNKSRIYDTANFGFPIAHTHGNKPKIIAAKIQGDKLKKIQRRSSPFIFKVIKVNNRTFFPVIIYLKGKLIGDGYKIIKDCDTLDEEEFGRIPEIGKDIIDEFTSYLMNGDECEEIVI